MTKQQRLEQLATVTDIIERNLPWEYQRNSGDWGAPDAALFTVLAWENPIRIKPTLIPLEASDIPPGSVVRLSDPEGRLEWFSIYSVGTRAVYIGIDDKVTIVDYQSLLTDWQINRSIPLLGKWDPTAWEPCSKLSPTNP